MKQIRNNVFETNSSSTHSICISKAPVTIGKHIRFSIGEYGWENDCVDTADYLYTAILEQRDRDELLEKLKYILNNHSIEYEFEEPTYIEVEDYKWLDYGYIDHSGETREFIDTVLSDDDMLMRCLFGDSCVYTGNDNSSDYDNMCYAAYDTIWDDNHKQIPNPNHDSENYDYFFKGN
jgi:hypothetical protein